VSQEEDFLAARRETARVATHGAAHSQAGSSTLTMGRVSRRQTAMQHAPRRLHLFTIVMCLEMVGLLSSVRMGAYGLKDVSPALFCRQLEQRRLRTLTENRYMCMDRRRVPKSKHWNLMVLDVFPDDQWRRYVRVDRSTDVRLGELLAPHLPFQRRRGRPRIPTDTITKVGMYRLGHYGNGAMTFVHIFLRLVGRGARVSLRVVCSLAG